MEIILDLNNKKERVNKRKKGKSILLYLHNYVVVDIETTGLDPYYDSIIEIAAVKVRNDKIAEKWQTLINPGFYIPEFVTELTSITNELLVNAPAIEEKIPEFMEFVEEEYLIAHNAHFDINFLYDSCMGVLNKPLTNNFVDTMRLSRKMFPEQERHRLLDLIEKFDISDRVEHRAMSDAINTHLCYECMKNLADTNVETPASFDFLLPTKQQYYYTKTSAKDISANVSEFNPDTQIYGKSFVFTGELQKMKRKEAM
ncbi:MAG: 3'-5' exoribonuclease, partial [Bacteroidales bacterium]|nr:3'-5' exoribonuclease [Bacteroidales bacterium]